MQVTFYLICFSTNPHLFQSHAFLKEEDENKSQSNKMGLNECEICHQTRAGKFYCIVFMQEELKSFDLVKL